MDERIELAEMHAASIRIETLQANLDSLEPRVSVAQHLPTFFEISSLDLRVHLACCKIWHKHTIGRGGT